MGGAVIAKIAMHRVTLSNGQSARYSVQDGGSRDH